MEQVKAEPVAWRWRRIGEDGPSHWIVRGTPRVSLPARAGRCAVEVEPLYATPQPAAVDGLVEALNRIANEGGETYNDWLDEGCDPKEAIRVVDHLARIACQALAQIERTEDAE